MSGRERPSWDQVQAWQARVKAEQDAAHAAAVASSPPRPTDVWRVCGHLFVDGVERRGCSCTGGGPWPEQVGPALKRLAAGGVR